MPFSYHVVSISICRRLVGIFWDCLLLADVSSANLVCVCLFCKWKHVKITDLLHSPSSSDRLISFKIRMTSVIMLNAISYYAISISVCWCCFCVPKDCFAPCIKTALSVI
jgi:hypothetical protein